ncbi:phage holin family protein [Pectinatus cerevisiiphilus]|uniref:Toxin secretion/phage lysis holin n=1 Tax=Pectinatus cerevisiiphilus TaxID=86956 RepID=A0A4R3K4S3_9FIRM|nr:phage holin family protein [Pectinatus cerevisiiphilus]TCS77651.1 toxin secretion/phage lysis holin [Pectinatus cerevisiiphilus]
MVLWTTTELKTGTLFGLLWGLLNLMLGGIDAPILALSGLIMLDFLTGITAAYKNAELNSRTGAAGLMRKAGIFVCIIIAYLLDTATGLMMFRGMVITGFAIIEVMSLVENFDRMGYGEIIPVFLRIHLQKIAAEKNLKVKESDDK